MSYALQPRCGQHLTGRDLSTARDRVDPYLACAIDTS